MNTNRPKTVNSNSHPVLTRDVAVLCKQPVAQQVPDDLHVHLVCDNYGTHKTPAINAWLSKHPRFHMHNTATSSSWINQVERWFGFITDELIRRGSHTSAQALEADIRAWANGWNEDPKPFIWTKSAEQILESIGQLYTDLLCGTLEPGDGYFRVLTGKLYSHR